MLNNTRYILHLVPELKTCMKIKLSYMALTFRHNFSITYL